MVPMAPVVIWVTDINTVPNCSRMTGPDRTLSSTLDLYITLALCDSTGHLDTHGSSVRMALGHHCGPSGNPDVGHLHGL